MYENNYKNVQETGSKDFELLLDLLSDLDKELELFALGGTAMVLADVKRATKDIDFLTTCDYESFAELMKNAGLNAHQHSSPLCGKWYLGDTTRIDVFFGETILGVTLPEDWKELSSLIQTKEKLKLYLLNWYDIIITKIARSEERDIHDIIAILKKEKVDFEKLKKRYYSIAETSLIQDYDLKFKLLERRIVQGE